MNNLQLFTNLDDSPELLAPFVLLTDFLWLGVEWWLCPCVSLLMLLSQLSLLSLLSSHRPLSWVNSDPCGNFLLSIHGGNCNLLFVVLRVL